MRPAAEGCRRAIRPVHCLPITGSWRVAKFCSEALPAPPNRELATPVPSLITSYSTTAQMGPAAGGLPPGHPSRALPAHHGVLALNCVAKFFLGEANVPS